MLTFTAAPLFVADTLLMNGIGCGIGGGGIKPGIVKNGIINAFTALVNACAVTTPWRAYTSVSRAVRA